MKYLIFCLITIAISCSITKQKQQEKTAQNQQTNIDSGNVKVSSGVQKSVNEWMKEWLFFNAKKDTNITINNTYPQPTIIYRESGKQTNESQFKNSDSNWKKAFDSLASVIQKTTKQKEEKAFDFWQIIALSLLVILIIIILFKRV